NDKMGGLEASEPGPLVDAVDDDDTTGAHLLRDGARIHAAPARALDDDGLARLEACDVEAGVDLRVRAVDARRHLVGDLVGELEGGVVRTQVEVLAEPALEVWPGFAGDEKVRLADGAGLEASRETDATAAAGEEV